MRAQLPGGGCRLRIIEQRNPEMGMFSSLSKRLRRANPMLAFWVVFGLGATVSLVLFAEGFARRRRRIEARFSSEAGERLSAFRGVVRRGVRRVDVLVAFHAADPKVERDDFRAFLAPYLAGGGQTQYAWAPKVSAEDRDAFEQRTRDGGLPDYEVVERLPGEALARAGDRQEYYPVRFLEPARGGGLALGLDLASDPAFLPVLGQARASGRVTATGALVSSSGEGFHSTYMIVKPVFRRGAPLDSLALRREHLTGFIVGVFDLQALLEEAVGSLAPNAIDVHVFDESAPPGQQLLACRASPPHAVDNAGVHNVADLLRAPGSMHWIERFEVAGRRWNAICTLAPGFGTDGGTRALWGWLGVGLTLAGLLAGYVYWVLAGVSRAQRVAAELEETNRRLADEVGERRQTEAALTRATEEWQMTFDAIDAYVAIIDPQFRILRANRALVEALGERALGERALGEQDVTGRHCHELIHGTAQRPADCVACAALTTGEPTHIELRESHLGNRWFDVSAYPLRGAAGEIRGVVHIMVDITKRKEDEAELGRYREHLEDLVRERTVKIQEQRQQVGEANRLKSEFLSTMSHELRTPLNSVLVLTQLMLARGIGRDPVKETEYLRVIRRNGQALLELINGILDLSRIEAGKATVALAPCRLGDVVRSAAEELRPLAVEKGLHLAVETEDLPTVCSDAKQIEQILVCLLENAVKFTHEGTIRLGGYRADGKVFLTVADTGIGISRNDLPRIFENFWQADGSDTRGYGGTGLGLAISRKRAALIGGTITVSSEPGKGSTFTLGIPMSQTEVQAPDPDPDPLIPALPPSPAPESAPSASILPVLVVEDNPDNQLAICGILDDIGCAYEVVGSGEEALASARRSPPGLVLMDIQLPGMDGLETTARIKAEPGLADVPVVALTAKAMRGDREKILAAGCTGYLSKPLVPETVAETIAKWVA